MHGAEDSNPACGSAQILERLEALVGQEHVSEDYVRFRIDLLKAQWAVCAALAESPPARQPAGQRRRDHNGKNQRLPAPALDPSAVPFDHGLLESLFEALHRAVAKRPAASADVSRLATAVAEEPALLEELARKAAFGPDQEYLESLSSRLDANVDALLFFGRVLAAPFVAEAARRDRGANGRAERATDVCGQCIVCGSPPALAKLRQDDGARILYCSLCGADWRFTRLACPFCGSRDHEALRFLRVTETDPRWIETCEKCRGYVKTVDARKLPAGEEIIPVVEDTGTLHLDLLAEKEGCVRRLPYAATS